MSVVMTESMKSGQDGLKAACMSKFAERSVPLRFDFGIFMPMVIQMLVEILGGLQCGDTRPKIIAARLKNARTDIWARMAIRQAVANANKKLGTGMTGQEQSLCREGIRDGFEDMDVGVRLGMCASIGE